MPISNNIEEILTYTIKTLKLEELC